jgi:hypothetical protein
MYKSWKILPEFCDVLVMVDAFSAVSTFDDNSNDGYELGGIRLQDKCDGGRCGDSSVPSEEELMDVGDSSDALESMADTVVGDRVVDDIRMTSDDDNGTVRLSYHMKHYFYTFFKECDKDTIEQTIEIPIETAIFSKR